MGGGRGSWFAKVRRKRRVVVFGCASALGRRDRDWRSIFGVLYVAAGVNVGQHQSSIAESLIPYWVVRDRAVGMALYTFSNPLIPDPPQSMDTDVPTLFKDIESN